MKKALTILIALLIVIPASARKTSFKFKGDDKSQTNEQAMARGTFMVASQCPDCNNGYRLEQIRFAGFDKPGSSSTESFFITNLSDRTMKGVNLYVEYLTPDGRQLHKRFLKLSCDIPPHETRKADIKSWDTQRSFHYEKSQPSKHSSPFTVRFDPVAFYLAF